MAPSIAAIIMAAGSSSRFLQRSSPYKEGVKKEYQPLGSAYLDDEGKPLTVLGAVLQTFNASPRLGPIVIAIPPHGESAEESARNCLPAAILTKLQGRLHFVPGGETRRTSVHKALSFLETLPLRPQYVLIHDGARPWLSLSLIERIIGAVIQYNAVIPALPLVETPKELEANEAVFIKRHLCRANIVTAQTPQAFTFPAILHAHEKAAEKEAREGFEYTDDAEVWAEFEGKVAVITGEPENRKITFPGDI
jgi:2-C-methyl-D-erythritol 4-phosphate cytidylyltransferase